MARYCTECGDKLEWDRKLRQYVCLSCGLVFDSEDLADNHQREEKDEEDYEDWWFNRK